MCAHVTLCMWMSESSLWGLVLSCEAELRLSTGQQAPLPAEPSCWPAEFNLNPRKI